MDFYVLRDLRVADLVLGLPWLDDEQTSFQFGTTRVFTFMDYTTVVTQTYERIPKCSPMSSTKIQKLLRKTRRRRRRNVYFYVIDVTPVAKKPTEFRNGEDLIGEQFENFRSSFYDDFPELLRPVDSPHLRRHLDLPIRLETTGPMKRQNLNRLSPTERVELNRQLNDAAEAGLNCPSHG
jgi:hypothetical protein